MLCDGSCKLQQCDNIHLVRTVLTWALYSWMHFGLDQKGVLSMLL